ncbi:BtpA/SgcQ family protein [Geminicoccus flavidas]|uniref:BtpA/SgcQ family protein n=1 Tax=Geminicoccus flavidas TaxID=2506407 RepID=UPI001F3AE021|nr:BtpA/SgcQ family protein [Geminicoccus flavidas]
MNRFNSGLPMSSTPVVRPRAHALKDLFGRQGGVVIGVVHLLPLPGAPEHDGEPVSAVYERAVRDAQAYAEGGVDGLIVENHGDIPFLKPDRIGPETAACMAVATERVIHTAGLPTGINVLANAAEVALAVAVASGAAFVRVNQWANAYVANEGIIEGPAAAALRYRKALSATGIRIFADSHVKHGAHAITADRSVAELTRDLEWSGADVVIATGQRTGDAAAKSEIAEIRGATSLPVLTGSGATIANIGNILRHASGAIVASSLKRDGVWWNEVEVDRVRALMAEAARHR